jgi:hypothetical protein
MKTVAKKIMSIAIALTMTSCAVGNEEALRASDSPLAIRSHQSRQFEVRDENLMMRAVIATLQDFDFVLDNLEPDMGAVTATMLDGQRLRMTVIVKGQGERSFQVRASAQSGNTAIETPEFYQTFFTGLQKSLFLDDQGID